MTSHRLKIKVHGSAVLLMLSAAIGYYVLTSVSHRSTDSETSTVRLLPTTHMPRTVRPVARKTPKIFCWVLTSKANIPTKAKAVRDTWTRRCDGRLFVTSDFTDVDFPAIATNVPEGRDHLTQKTFAAFRHLYVEYINDYDWFLKADDDTYVIVDNLRHFLGAHDPMSSVYFGQYIKGKPKPDQGYHSGGAAYVLSHAALKRMQEIGRYDAKYGCLAPKTGLEDMDLGICLENLDINLGFTNDTDNAMTFHSFNPTVLLNKEEPLYSVYKYERDGVRIGSKKAARQILANFSISFHYMDPGMIYFMDYLIYHLQLHTDVLSSLRYLAN